MPTKGKNNKYGTSSKSKINYPYAKKFNTISDKDAEHFLKHAVELNIKTKEEYIKRAIEFANDINKIHYLSFTDNLGKTYKYNELTNEFIIVSSSGKILTYFAPKKGIDYFNERKDKYAVN